MDLLRLFVVCKVESFSENNPSWNTFHKVFNTLEVNNHTYKIFLHILTKCI